MQTTSKLFSEKIKTDNLTANTILRFLVSSGRAKALEPAERAQGSIGRRMHRYELGEDAVKFFGLTDEKTT